MTGTAEPGGETADFRPTHVVPQDGMPAWEAPDVDRPTAPLDPFLPVQLLSRRGAWAEILCSNGWSAWVDGRLLVAVPQPPPTAGDEPLLRAEDPRPLLARSAAGLERYRQAVEELAAGNTDAEGFGRSVHGLRAGVVLDGESVWLYDAAGGRWVYGDGTRLATYAVDVPQDSQPDAQTSPAGPAGPADPVEVQLDVLPERTAGSGPTRVTPAPGADPREQ
ncbi:hypothetical protein [Streptomyces sp. cmx-4-9]|uniref:hypothetical protein n=1 Tax=Streptomyces sp. cmx-4-9 TaxID=2790941 RepID=UPI003980D0C5